MCKFMRLTIFKSEAIFKLKLADATVIVANLDRSKAKPLTLGPNVTALAIWRYTSLTVF